MKIVGGEWGYTRMRAPTSGGATCRCAACPRSSSGSAWAQSCGRPRRRAPCGSSSSGPSSVVSGRGPGPPGHRGPARCAAAVETTTGAPTRLATRRAFVSSRPALERHSSIFQRTCPWHHQVYETSFYRASRRRPALGPATCRREAPPRYPAALVGQAVSSRCPQGIALVRLLVPHHLPLRQLASSFRSEDVQALSHHHLLLMPHLCKRRSWPTWDGEA